MLTLFDSFLFAFARDHPPNDTGRTRSQRKQKQKYSMVRQRRTSTSKFAAEDSSDDDLDVASSLSPSKVSVSWADERGEELEYVKPATPQHTNAISDLQAQLAQLEAEQKAERKAQIDELRRPIPKRKKKVAETKKETPPSVVAQEPQTLSARWEALQQSNAVIALRMSRVPNLAHAPLAIRRRYRRDVSRFCRISAKIRTQ